MQRVGMRWAVLSAAMLLCAARGASAQVVLTGQDRAVFAESTASPPSDNDSELISAPAFDVFQDDAFAGATGSSGLDAIQVTSTADQYSEMHLSGIFGVGVSGVVIIRNNPPGGVGGNGVGESTFGYAFEVGSSTSYSVLGELSAFGGSSDAGLILTGPLGEVFSFGAGPVSDSGTLVPGAYTLSTFAEAGLSAAHPAVTAGAEFELLFRLDVFEPGVLLNAQFETDSLLGWTLTLVGGSSVEALNGQAVLTSGSPAELSQELDTFADEFAIRFDYEFLDAQGGDELEVLLDGVLLLTLDQTDPISGTQTVTVSNPALFGLSNADLVFRFDSTTAGSAIAIDNINIVPVPEPGAWLLMTVGCAGLLCVCRARNRRPGVDPR